MVSVIWLRNPFGAVSHNTRSPTFTKTTTNGITAESRMSSSLRVILHQSACPGNSPRPVRSVPSCAVGRRLFGEMLKARNPAQELLFAEHHTTADLVIGNPLASCEFVDQTLADIEKGCGFGEVVEPLAGYFLWSWLTLRFMRGRIPCLLEFPLNGLERWDEVPQNDGDRGCCCIHGTIEITRRCGREELKHSPSVPRSATGNFLEARQPGRQMLFADEDSSPDSVVGHLLACDEPVE